MTHRLSIASGCLLDTDPMTVIEVGAAAGFDSVGLRLSREHRLDPHQQHDVRQRADASGITIFDAEVHRIGHRDTTADGRAALIDAATCVGAEWLLVVSDLPGIPETVDAIGTIVEQCRVGGIRAAVEYMAWTTPNCPNDAMQVAAATGAGIIVDVLHHHRVGGTVDDFAVLVASGHLAWVQLCDAPSAAADDLIHEARHDRLLPGDGGLPIGAMLALVPDDITISVEAPSDRLRAALAPAQRAVALMRSAQDVLS